MINIIIDMKFSKFNENAFVVLWPTVFKFCGAVGLVKNWKVAKFGFNPISQFRTRLVFMTEICIFSYFSVFSQFWLNFASASLRKSRTEANFCHLLAFAKPAAPQKFQPQITIKTGKDWLRPKRPVKDWRPSLLPAPDNPIYKRKFSALCMRRSIWVMTVERKQDQQCHVTPMLILLFLNVS